MDSNEAGPSSETTGGHEPAEGAHFHRNSSGTVSTAGSSAGQPFGPGLSAGPDPESAADPSAESSGLNSRDEHTGDSRARGHHRVRFGIAHSEGDLPSRAAAEVTQQSRGMLSPPKSAFASPKRALTRNSSLDGHDRAALSASTSKPSIPLQPLPTSLGNGEDEQDEQDQDEILFMRQTRVASQRTAENKAKELSRQLEGGQKSKSTPALSAPGDGISPPPSPSPFSKTPQIFLDLEDIPPEDLEKRRKYGIDDDTESESEGEVPKTRLGRFIRSTRRFLGLRSSRHELSRVQATDWPASGYVTPIENRYDRQHAEDSAQAIRSSALAALLGLRAHQGSQDDLEAAETPRKGSLVATPKSSPPQSGQTTPRKHKIHVPDWHDKAEKGDSRRSSASITSLFDSSASAHRDPRSDRGPTTPRPKSSGAVETIKSLGRKKKAKRYTDIPQHVEVHIDDMVVRHKYVLKCCRAMMKYGAPTHRLEEYMRMSARALSINGQFLYIPGCMIFSFDDEFTHTAEVKVVRESQGVDLSRLTVVHSIYKAVLHDKLDPKEACTSLDDLMENKPKFRAWTCVVTTGLASAFVGPFAFDARLIDMPIAFVLGSLLGFVQYVMSPKSDHYTDVFEIFAAILTSFFARLFGSLRGGSLFCFSALAQSSIALILPGYVVLCAALELQSRNIVAGSVRMVYAIIYSLFLGFGIMIGSSIYGAIDPRASSQTTCAEAAGLGWWRLAFVPAFTTCLAVVNHARGRDLPPMLVIAWCGYLVNTFSARRFPRSPQIANALGALTIGVLGNLHSRVGRGVSAAVVMPAIFVQVPSGLAAGGSLISGIAGADQIVANASAPAGAAAGNVTAIPDGSQGGRQAGDVQSVIFNVGASMIRVAVGLTVGLFVSSVVVYPFPKSKKRSGLFTF